MDPYPGLKKKDKEFLESVNSKIRSGTYRDPGTLTRNLKAINKKISGYQAKVSSYERSNTRKKIETLSQARLRMQEAGIAPAPVPNVPVVAHNVPAILPNVPAVAPNVPVPLEESPAVADSIDLSAPMVAAPLSPILEVSTAEERSNSTENKGDIGFTPSSKNNINDKSKFNTVIIDGNGWCFYAAILRGLGQPYDSESSRKFANEISEWLKNNRASILERNIQQTLEERYNSTVGGKSIPIYGNNSRHSGTLTFDEYINLSKELTNSKAPIVWAETSVAGYAAADLKNIRVNIYSDTTDHVERYVPKNGQYSGVVNIINTNGNHFDLLVPKGEAPSAVGVVPKSLKKTDGSSVTGGQVTDAPVLVAVENNHKDLEDTEASELESLKRKRDECLKACSELKKQIDIIHFIMVI